MASRILIIEDQPDILAAMRCDDKEKQLELLQNALNW